MAFSPDRDFTLLPLDSSRPSAYIVTMTNATHLPLFMDATAKAIGYVATPNGTRTLFCKAGRYYTHAAGSFRTLPISRAKAAAAFVPFENEAVN